MAVSTKRTMSSKYDIAGVCMSDLAEGEVDELTNQSDGMLRHGSVIFMPIAQPRLHSQTELTGWSS